MKKDRTSGPVSRRKFLHESLAIGVAGSASVAGFPMVTNTTSGQTSDGAGNGKSFISSNGEVLYNGIVLPETWPPRDMQPDSYEPMPVPYLQSPPDVIPIDVGRQLFVDDFLIAYTDLERRFHQPEKHEANPILTPETEVELNHGFCPTAAPFSDGCFYDPKDKLFKLYYMAGWFDGVALATSKDGIHWERPALDVVPGTNLVLNPGQLRRDGVSVWLDHDASDRSERFKMYYWARTGDIGAKLTGGAGYILTSADGIHWDWRGETGETGDNSTMFYNPFRDVWSFTMRKYGRALPPWAGQHDWNGRPRGRARSYWEAGDFLSALGDWSGHNPVFWLGADKLDHKRPDYPIGRVPQIYKVNAVGYESLMLGLIQPHYGPPNNVCAEEGFPKLTELQLAFSRDGFHWDRSSRDTFIGATLEDESWERAYIHSVGGVCNVVGDKLYFYYTAFQGDQSNRNPNPHWNGMYANASTGLAVLRRDGFASLDAGEQEGVLLTRPLRFTGEYLFLNLESLNGELRVEVCEEGGKAIPGFSRDECLPITADSTKNKVEWRNRDSLESIAEMPVRFKFYVANSKLYAFWVTRDKSGKSGGAIAAGGPGFSGTWDS